ncbi:hypothetical protein IAI17_42640, partial [Escherichia coli]|nr:hypothetical protein [Escherichia coli]
MSDEWRDRLRASAGLARSQQMLHRNKAREAKIGETRFLFAYITQRYGREEARP